MKDGRWHRRRSCRTPEWRPRGRRRARTPAGERHQAARPSPPAVREGTAGAGGPLPDSPRGSRVGSRRVPVKRVDCTRACVPATPLIRCPRVPQTSLEPCADIRGIPKNLWRPAAPRPRPSSAPLAGRLAGARVRAIGRSPACVVPPWRFRKAPCRTFAPVEDLECGDQTWPAISPFRGAASQAFGRTRPRFTPPCARRAPRRRSPDLRWRA